MVFRNVWKALGFEVKLDLKKIYMEKWDNVCFLKRNMGLGRLCVISFFFFFYEQMKVSHLYWYQTTCMWEGSWLSPHTLCLNKKYCSSAADIAFLVRVYRWINWVWAPPVHSMNTNICEKGELTTENLLLMWFANTITPVARGTALQYTLLPLWHKPCGPSGANGHGSSEFVSILGNEPSQ